MRSIGVYMAARLLCSAVVALIAMAGSAPAGLNQFARVSIDADPATWGEYTIDTLVSSYTSAFTIAIVARDVVDLDTYSFSIVYDNRKLTYVNASADLNVTVRNILRAHGGEIVWFPTRKPGPTHDTVMISCTLVGQDTALSANGSGLLGIIQFNTAALPGDTARVHLQEALMLDTYRREDSLTDLHDARVVLSAPLSVPALRLAGIAPCFSILLIIGVRTVYRIQGRTGVGKERKRA